jgi:HlyD family secretion protein
MARERDSSAAASIDRHLMVGLVTAGLLIFGAGGWAVTTELSGAVLASGTIVVDGHVKTVQHPLGGVVEEIAVRNGQLVRQGDIVLRLDDDVARADLGVVDNALDALVVRQARLEAERDGAAVLEMPRFVADRLAEPALAAMVRSETRYFDSRVQARNGLRAQLRERIEQHAEQIEGLSLQAKAQEESLGLVADELEGLEQLYAQKLITQNRVMVLRREAATMRGSLGQLLAEIAATKGQVSETELQIIQIDQDLRSEVNKELRETAEKIAELGQRRIAALDQLKRIDIRAPHDGIVHELSVHTVGGVISAGDPLMLIVPEEELLVVEAKVAAQDRDQLHVGQPALLRMSAFNQRTTPELQGEVSVIGADLVEDVRSGFQYYPVRMKLMPREQERLGANVLAPGMPVESFIQTGYRTVFSYLTKPIADYLAKAFRAD